MRLSYTEVWNEAMALIRRHRPVLVALAGAFYFLPNLFVAYLAPFEVPRQGISLVEAMVAHVRGNWAILIAATLVELAGTLAVLNLLLKPGGRTVGAAIAGSLALLPTVFVAGFLTNLMLLAGFVLLVLPGIYLLGRLALVPASIVGEEQRNPLAAIRRSLALTQSRGWAVAGLFVLVFVLAAVTGIAISSALGVVSILIVGRELGLLIAEIGSAAVWAAAHLVQVAIAAILYLRFASPPQAPRPPQTASGT